MRSAFKSALGRSSASCRSIASYGPARAQVLAVTQQQQRQPPVSAPGGDTVPRTPSSLGPATNEAGLLVAGGKQLSRTYFDATGAAWTDIRGEQPQDPNKANLGKTLRILQDRLPTLLQSPLPQHLLAPNISLNLFPSTHPHLPTVSGRVAYTAALWSSPIAWNRVPIIGNVRLEILAERMTSEPLTFLPRRAGAIPEQLVVRWCEKRKGGAEGAGKAGEGGLAGGEGLETGAAGAEGGKAFTGLFIFDFDAEGRILTHTIETAQQGGNWEKGVGAKFVGLTDWLLGGMRDPGETIPMFERIPKKQRLQ